MTRTRSGQTLVGRVSYVRMAEADFSLGTTLFRLRPSIRTRQRGRSSLTVHTRLVRTEAPRHSASKVGMKLDNFENRSSFRGCEIVRPPREPTNSYLIEIWLLLQIDKFPCRNDFLSYKNVCLIEILISSVESCFFSEFGEYSLLVFFFLSIE